MIVPTPEETRKCLTDEKYKEYSFIGESLQKKYGKPTIKINIVGWLWKNISEAERIGWNDSFIKQNLDSAYLSLLKHMIESDS